MLAGGWLLADRITCSLAPAHCAGRSRPASYCCATTEPLVVDVADTTPLPALLTTVFL
jgi:hypothetical protein